MDCPNCGIGIKMERTDCYEIIVTHNLRYVLIPTAIYICSECAGEWIWIKGRQGLRQVSEPILDLCQLVQARAQLQFSQVISKADENDGENEDEEEDE